MLNNTSCIFTVIKDEQEYLEEFIIYHLNLGVNHIFIFEDVNSTSHKNICDKYLDRVTLNSIKMFSFDEYKRNDIHNNWDDYRQNAYCREGLDWIKNNFNYDWVFCIDCDEYVTLEDETKTLPEVLNMYSDYGAIILSWQNYNANGYIKKPNYKGRGLVNTYTQKCSKSINDAQWKSTKIVFKFERFKKNYYLGSHICSDLCKWIKSDFSRDHNKPIYKNIYIRHYITKSWEEYVWKLKTRGMFHKTHRNFEEFFEMNPDLKDKKEELLNELNKI